MTPQQQPATFAEFWPFYVAQHARAGTRAWHLLGTTAALVCLARMAWDRPLTWLGAAVVVGYGCAWVGHFFVEHNRPATFRHPLWSLRADARMYGLMLTGRMRAEVARTQGLEAARHKAADQLSEGAAR